ncbi:MAG TPA: amidase family protein, partial [Terriglobus sp.]
TAPPTLASEYIRAKFELHHLRRTIDQTFQDFDLLVLPTERIFPFTVEESFEMSAEAQVVGGVSPKQMIIIANTYPFNMYGIPALTMPCGFSSTGLPIGITIAGPRFSEGKLLAVASAYQKITNWHKLTPKAVLS